MPTAQEFESFFHRRADLAERLHAEDARTEAYLIASVALDALATIADAAGHVPANQRPALRLAEFVAQHADPVLARRLAVVFLAQDMIANGPVRLHPIATRLLTVRAAAKGPKPTELEMRECPHAHRDTDWAGLVTEEPALASEARLEAIAAEYSYPALVYRLYRCGPAHALSRGSRTSGFSQAAPDDEISYFPEWISNGVVRPIGLKVGLLVITGWVRKCASSYALHCTALGASEPARGFDPSAESLERLARVWKSIV
jgi:hypothetical protein